MGKQRESDQTRIAKLLGLYYGNQQKWDKDGDSEAWFIETHNRRLKHKPVLKGEKERTIVEFLAAWFNTSRFSHFQYEGEARVALRLMILRAGHSWQRSDDEAHRLIQLALHEIGAQRPRKEEASSEWTVEEWCGFCRGPLDDESVARRDRFCCSECAKMAIAKRHWDKGGYIRDYYGQAAYRQIRREDFPEKTCKNCNRPFRPNVLTPKEWERQQYCSARCGNESRQIRHEITCQNPACRKTFLTNNPSRIFCSRACSDAGYSSLLEERRCCHCSKPYQPKRPQAMYCGSKCAQLAAYYRRKANEAAMTDPESPVGKLFDKAA